MIYDPFIEIITQLGFSWWSFWLSVAIFDILVNLFFLWSFGGIWWDERIKEFFQDKLALFWPFFVLGPVAGAYLLVHEIGIYIQFNLIQIGFQYSWLSLGANIHIPLFIVIISVAAGIAIATRLRYEKYRPNIWFNRPRIFGRIRTITIDFPMGIMLLFTSFRLIEQWILLNTFLTSKWLPQLPYHTDRMYGVRWIYEIVIIQIVVVLLVSLTPSLMMLRENNQKYVWMYKTLIPVGVLFAIVGTIVLAINFHMHLQFIYSHFFTRLTAVIDFNSVGTQSTAESLTRQLVISQHLSNLLSLPSGFPLPAWLTGLVTARVLIGILSAYNFLSERYGLPPIPKLLMRLLDNDLVIQGK